jgi:hypothetical protein
MRKQKMIFIYNDTADSPWRLNSSNRNVCTISGGRKVENVFKGITMNASSEGLASADEFSSLVNNKTDLKCVCSGNTSIHYGKYDNMPNIGTQGSNKNIYFIAKDIRGCRIKSITRQDVFIFQYSIVRGTLYLALSTTENCKSIDIELFNKEKALETKTTFDLTTYTVKTTTKKVKPDYEPEQFKIRAFRPSRITTAILVSEEDKQYLPESVTNNDDNHAMYVYDNTDENDYGANAKKALADKYTAITVITDLEDVINNDFGKYDDMITYLRSAFNQINIYLGNNPNKKIVKR